MTNEPNSGSSETDSTVAKQVAATHLYPDEKLSSEIRQGEFGSIHDITRVFTTSASFGVVKTGIAVEHEFVRNIEGHIVDFRVYEDAADRTTLDAIAWDFVEHAEIVRR